MNSFVVLEMFEGGWYVSSRIFCEFCEVAVCPICDRSGSYRNGDEYADVNLILF